MTYKNYLSRLYILMFFGGFLWACQESRPTSELSKAQAPGTQADTLYMTKAILYDKVLGMLLGSAIGDAMGAPTEMWGRRDITIQYGYVQDLDTMVREPSPEGTWAYNLPAGGTTDDTRWKKLVLEYLIAQKTNKKGHQSTLEPRGWAEKILNYYEKSIDSLKNTESFQPEPFEIRARQMAWVQEWAMVAKPFLKNDLQEYNDALSHFYGGEMVCAGLLYSPMIGAYYPIHPTRAYQEAYKLSFFDLGYARDISAITAAMVSAAMDTAATPASVLGLIRTVDPQHYFKSRLVGRASFYIFTRTQSFIYETKKLRKEQYLAEELQNLPNPLPVDTLTWLQMQRIYQFLDKAQQDAPFHAAEIYMINLAALLFADFDYEKTLAFVINYGRDNDTVAAVTGAILGAYWGAKKLPAESVRRVLEVNKNQLGIDLEKLAQELTDKIATRYYLVGR